MTASSRAKCRSCGAQIIWTVTENGRRSPVDALPSEDGNLILFEGDDGEVRSRVVGDTLFGDDQRFKSHFATCPNATTHRRASR